ncbi:MAG: hypothetical protein ABR999_02760 [Methanoregula sp.]|jgi:hypothetical protein|uniref:hypothetical protein n=1 Tax=Methanoregula sp. TaxID=2052170 RepID=UPI003D0AA999
MTCNFVTGSWGYCQCSCTDRRKCPKGAVVEAVMVSHECFSIETKKAPQNADKTVLQGGFV